MVKAWCLTVCQIYMFGAILGFGTVSELFCAKVEILALCYNSGDFCRYNFGIAQREMFLRHVKTFGTQLGSKLLLKIWGWKNTPNSLKERFVITIIDIVTIILINNWHKNNFRYDRIVFMLLKILIFFKEKN